MKPIFYLFVNFGPRNVFVNVFKNEADKRTPLLSRTLNAANYVNGTYHPNLTTLNEFLETIAEWIKVKKPSNVSLVVVFKNFGVKFRKKAQTLLITQKRKLLIKLLRRERINISKLVDTSPISFNGCMQKKKRRKKRKEYKKRVKKKDSESSKN